MLFQAHFHLIFFPNVKQKSYGVTMSSIAFDPDNYATAGALLHPLSLCFRTPSPSNCDGLSSIPFQH
jgi:hypothetical protein